MRINIVRIAVCVAFSFIMSASLSRAEDDKIEQIMKKAFKGDNSLYKKVATGKGTPADNTKLAEMLKGLEGTKPPRGDLAAWKQRVSELIKAADDVAAGKPNALEELQMSGKCKGCHRDHKEDEEHEHKGRGKKDD